MMLSFRPAEQSGLMVFFTVRVLGDLESICSPCVYCEIPEAIGVRFGERVLPWLYYPPVNYNLCKVNIFRG